MPVIVAAVCPHPPLLIPAVASGAAPELDDLRAACATAVGELIAAGPDRIVVLGSGPHPSGAEVGRPDVPLSLALGEWLLGECLLDGAGPAEFHPVPTGAGPAECAAAGQGLAASPDRVALLVMGDGSACRGPQAPGYDDPRAESFDRTVAAALAGADAAALLAIDPELAEQLRCAGRAPWQVLAGAVGHQGDWHARVTFDQAPYGVAYFVAIMKLVS